MAISFKALELAAKKLQDIRTLEDIIEVNGVKVVIRCLTQTEEIEATQYFESLYEEYEHLTQGLSAHAAFGHCNRLAHLSYAIVQIDDLDFRGEEYVEISEGEEVPKHEAVMKVVVENWDSDLQLHLFMKFAAFSMENSVSLISQVKIETKNLDDQIVFHKEKLQELEEKRKTLKGQTVKDKLTAAFPQEETSEVSKGPESSEQEVDSVILNPSPNSFTEEQIEKQREPKDPREEKWEDIESSFLNDEDPNAALMAETQRLQSIQRANAHQKNSPAQTPQEPSEEPVLNRGLPEMPIRRVPRPQSQSVGSEVINDQVGSLRGAFQTGNKIVMVDPEESVPLETRAPTQTTPVKRRGGTLNPNFKKNK